MALTVVSREIAVRPTRFSSLTKAVKPIDILYLSALCTLGKTVIASHNGSGGGRRAFLLHLSLTESESIPGTSIVIVDVKKEII